MKPRTLPHRWCVWNDSFNGEILAVEAEKMTDALRHSLAQEHAMIREVQAQDRRAAVRGAFPEAFPQPEGALPRASLRVH